MGCSLTIYDKDSIRWCSGKSVQIEDTWVRATQNRVRIERHGGSSEDIDAQISKLKRWWKEVKITNSDCETPTPDTGKSKHEQWSRVEKEWVALTEDKVYATSGKKKANVRRETSAVSGMRVTIVHKDRHRKPPHLLSHQWHEVEVCRGKEVSRAKVILVSFFNNRAHILLERWMYEIALWVLAFSRMSIL